MFRRSGNNRVSILNVGGLSIWRIGQIPHHASYETIPLNSVMFISLEDIMEDLTKHFLELVRLAATDLAPDIEKILT